MHVTVYTKQDCIYCTNAKMLLSQRGINYTELKLGEDFTRDNVLQIFPEARTFPIVVIDGYNIGGFNELQKYLVESTQNTQKLLNEGTL